MMQIIKKFFTVGGWKENCKEYLVVVAYGLFCFVIGSFGGAFIQFIKDLCK